MIYSQQSIYDSLTQNPLSVPVYVGDAENLNGGDYIFLDFTNESVISYDNSGTYQTYIQITIATRDFENRRTLVNFVKSLFTVSITYEKANDFEYFLARCECGVLMSEEYQS